MPGHAEEVVEKARGTGGQIEGADPNGAFDLTSSS